ncbi:cyanogenic beta-glucosidase-like [Mercurialis annua]|uniref:cyanogenic beta-glucosidase-like n=1 Tax=Mercurialis annua TaxID=3986 RepID=UPI00215E898D|nr:cyanogenic beta-glucosidase-like [Mercurialis annua]
MNMNMEAKSSHMPMLLLLLLIINSSVSTYQTETPAVPVSKFDSSYFPPGFLWGTSNSAYQTEGEANSKGRGPSIWDTFTHKYPERIDDRSNGDVATDSYNLYKDDIKKMNEDVGMNAYRFSISWSRIIPSGKLSKGVNEEGIDFYNRLINETLKNGLVPFVTIFHWDVPQGLEDEYGGFLSPKIVSDFKDYAEVCFERFGDRVKHWISMNEPFVFATKGYDCGSLAPGRCSSWVNKACQAGNSTVEPYMVGHHLLLSHAAIVQTYKQMDENGKIGITLDITWTEPYSTSAADRAAAQRNLDFTYGWFMDPLTYGYYPKIMRTLIGQRLPYFTKKQALLLKGSYDFIGLNYYTSIYASANVTAPDPNPSHIRFGTESAVNLTEYRDGKAIGIQASPSWLYIVPQGIRYVLNYTKDRYHDPVLYITENGIGNDKNRRRDVMRIQFFEQHVWNVLKSICDYKVNVKGYFARSFMDNFEWSSGYTLKMGLYAVDRKTMARYPKLSVAWFNKFLQYKNSTGGPKCGF